jgi:hypothetical protein
MPVPPSVKRFSIARGVIFAGILLLVILAFVLHLGALSFLVRGILVLGVFAFLASYVVEFLIKWRGRKTQ